MNQNSYDTLLFVGKVIRPHGSRGLLRTWIYAGDKASFFDSGTVFLRPVSGQAGRFTISSVKPHKNIFLMKLAELNSREEAEEQRNAEILVEKKGLSCEEDEYFWHELLHLKVWLDSGRFLGEISQIIPTGGNDIYVVTLGDKECLIPATHEVIKKIDLKNGKMVVSEMEGLLDFNEV